MGKKENKAKTQKESEDFDKFLKDLQKVTKASGKADSKTHKKGGGGGGAGEQSIQHLTNEERKQKHKERMEAIQKAKSADFERMMEKQQQQQQLQQLIQQMLSANKPPFLSKPVEDFVGEEFKGDKFDAATGEMQGWRLAQEDAFVTKVAFELGGKMCGLFGVFDGHAGAKCALLAKAVMPAVVTKFFDPTKEGYGLVEAYTELDTNLQDKLSDSSGSTAVTVVVTDTHYICANVGDSRAILCRKDGKVVPLSSDHKPEDPKESERIIAAGGQVRMNRVNGQLAMSRALGDFSYKTQTELPKDKQLVIAVPDVQVEPREPGDDFLVVACDGIFDVLSNEELVEFVGTAIRDTAQPAVADGEQPKGPLLNACEKVCRRCLAPMNENDQPAVGAGTDNMTITIVKLK